MKFRVVVIDGKFRYASIWYDASKFSIKKLMEAIEPFKNSDNWMLEYKRHD